MVRCGTRLLQAALFSLLCAIVLLFLPAGTVAESGAALVVQGASGNAGDTVGVTVSLRGIKSLPGVEGLSGGEFELHYDPAIASIEKISKGSIIGSGFMFLENKKFSENSAKITLAAASGLITKDGDLCNVTFKLKKKGAVEVTLKGISLYDQDVRALTMGAVSELPQDDPSGEGSPGGGGGLSVEILSPDEASPPPGDTPAASDDPADSTDKTDEEVFPPGEEYEGDVPAIPEGEVSKSGKAASLPRWLLPAAGGFFLLVIIVVVYFYINRRRSHDHNI